MNKKRLAVIIVIAVAVLALIGFLGYTANHEGSVSPDQESSVDGQIPDSPDGAGAVSPQEGDGAAASDGTSSSPSDPVYQLDPDTGLPQTPDSKYSVPAASGGIAIEQQKTLRADTVVDYFGRVPNDTTGKMRCSGYTSGTAQEELALDYYKAFFGSDDEIHALINYAAGNTARITVLDDDTLDVTIMEHIDGEELNADTLCNGNILVKYWVHKSSGEITEVHPD